MAEIDRQMNYWFGVPGLEMRSARAGGGPGAISADAMLENIRPPVAANDPASVGRAPVNYRGAVTRQTIEQAIDQNTHVGDYQYWQSLADKEGHVSPTLKAPSGMQAATNYSRGGKTTLYVTPDGRRYVFRDGELLAKENQTDFSR